MKEEEEAANCELEVEELKVMETTAEMLQERAAVVERTRKDQQK